MMAGTIAKHVVSCSEDLSKVACKAPKAVVVLPELADEESPDGWEVLGETPHRVEASVREILEKALHDLQHEIPEQYRELPAVKEQCAKLKSLLDVVETFNVELRDPAGGSLGNEDIRQDVQVTSDGLAPEWVQAFLAGGDPREHTPSEWKDADLGDKTLQPDLGKRVMELGSSEELKRCVIAPGNGCTPIADANWYAWLADELKAGELFDEVVCKDFPDPLNAKRSKWLPFMRDKLCVGPDTVLVGHSSGAVAAMRFAEEQVVGGLVLVSACHSDLGDEGERASGYYPPGGGDWRWADIRKNAGWIIQFHSTDDHLVPVTEGRVVSKELQSEYHELQGHSHFFEPFREILEAIRSKMAK